MLTDPKLRSQVDALRDKFWTGKKPAEGVSAKVLRSESRVHAMVTIDTRHDETCQVCGAGRGSAREDGRGGEAGQRVV